MQLIFENIDVWMLPLLFIIGAAAYLVSTLGGGGGSLLLVPVVEFMLGAKSAAPILNLGAMIGRPSRLIIFWKSINWKLVLYYAPAALFGAFAGGLLFQKLRAEWLQVVIALFLISTLIQYRFGKKEHSFSMQLPYFIPLGFLIALLSTLVGAMGPVLNPFYLNAGIDKEDMIATKTDNSFFMGVVQISTYAFFGSLHGQLWIYGIVLGFGATAGNIAGKILLNKMSRLNFRRWVIAIMVITGVVMLVKQLSSFL